MSMLNVHNIAGSALSAQSMRLNAVASNLANADSVAGPDGQPYRAKQVVFAATSVEGGAKLEGAAMGVRVTGVVEDLAPPRIIFDPKNPAANEQGFVTMPNVNVVEEMVEHDFRLARLPEQRRGDEHRQDADAEDPGPRPIKEIDS
ncbi:MAG: flagellar basal body rod protein FlgC [Rhodocyclaceae bacterium]|nr:flagellar basal body rod protein FlgC [Rhodocyclaceae bacterium]